MDELTLDQKINYCRDKMGGIVIVGRMIKDFPQDGQSSYGWIITPIQSNLVAVFPTYYWGIGVGPRENREEAINSLYDELSKCLRIEVGEPGPRRKGHEGGI